MEVSSSQCAQVEGEDEETIPISQPWALPGSSDHLSGVPWASTGPTHFSSRTGARVISVILLQYHTMMIRMLGVRKVFMANHTLVKPPF